MTFFSRLSDIVSCNLSELLAQSADPAAALRQLISEMDEGLSGARRSVQAASRSVERLEGEIAEHKSQRDHWLQQARTEVQQGQEEAARNCLRRKQELEDLLGGLDQQLTAAVSTFDHLQKMFRAIEARLADARRRQDSNVLVAAESTALQESCGLSDPSREAEIEAELAALRQEVRKA